MQHASQHVSQEEDYNLVETWLRKDPSRWAAGFLAGLFAGVVALGLASIISVMAGKEFTFAVKLMATPLLGSFATEAGTQAAAVIAGFILFEAICAFWGLVFAHFTQTNHLSSLLAMGLVWGLFSWIFIWNLFLQSFDPIFWAQISAGAVFPICLAYGISLTSVAFFDRIMGGDN